MTEYLLNVQYTANGLSGQPSEHDFGTALIGRHRNLQSAAPKTYNQPMSGPIFYPRSVERLLVEALEDSPVVLIHGPRQCGKTTLAQIACAPSVLTWRSETLIWRGKPLSQGRSPEDPDYSYFSFDDPVTRDSARSDPMGFVADLPERVILGACAVR